MLRHLKKFTFTSILALMLSACMQTLLSVPELTRDEVRLNATNPRKLDLSVSASIPDSYKTGHQYLLLFIPFGSILLDDPADALKTSIQRHWAMRGYRVHFDRKPGLIVSLKSLSLTAFDFFFFRRISCSGELEIKVPTGLLASYPPEIVEFSKSGIFRYAFEPQLEEQLAACFDEAASRLSIFMGRE